VLNGDEMNNKHKKVTDTIIEAMIDAGNLPAEYSYYFWGITYTFYI
jgi:hypothetical protein